LMMVVLVVGVGLVGCLASAAAVVGSVMVRSPVVEGPSSQEVEALSILVADLAYEMVGL
jgi:hypothetical protein